MSSTTRTKVRDINTSLLDMLGVPWQDQDVVGVTLRMRGGRVPTLTVHRILLNKPQASESLQRFELRPIETQTSPIASEAKDQS